LKAACTFYEEAIKAFEIEAFHARAHAGVAESCVLLALGSVDKVERKRLYEKARAAAEKSLQLNPHLPEGHAARAELMFRFDRDWLNADEEFRKAIEPNPSYSTAHHWYSIYLTAMGRHDASKTEASKAQDLDPMSCIINTDAAWPYFNTGDYGKALKNCERALEIDRDFWLAHWVRGLILEQQGGIAKSQEKFREAIKEFEKAKRPWPSDPRLSARIARVYALSGETKIARTMLEELLTQRNATYVSPYFLAGAYEALKEHDNAIRCLKEAFKENSPTLVFLQVDPTMATLRAKSAVQDLLVQLRFPQVKEEIRQGRAATLFPM